MAKSRNQNNVVGSTIELKLLARNSNCFADLYNIDHIDIYKQECADNTDACATVTNETLIETIDGSSVVHDGTGLYHYDLVTSSPLYTIGKYHDIWTVTFNENDVPTLFKQDFQLYPDLWILSGTPVVYSFDFRFTPNRIRKGSVKWLIIQIIPNVPRATDLMKYYENLAISADLRITIEQNCGPCLPTERDLRIVIDNELVTERDKVFAYYKIDTSDWDCGIYNVTFELCYAGNVDISPVQQFQIY